MRALLLAAYRAGYEGLARPLIFRGDADRAHAQALAWLRRLDAALPTAALQAIERTVSAAHPTRAGGVTLPGPLILAAGWVKGDGYASEAEALDAVRAGRNIMPGWRGLPALVGPVEFGSFTRWPRIGNSGRVIWRDAATRSTQNRIGLRNPGAAAAAAFLAARHDHLPACWGINLATSPGVDDPAQEEQEIAAALAAFLHVKIIPTWLTLNLSCPNTEDDPGANQTAGKARRLCEALLEGLSRAGAAVPLWVKVGPDLAEEQYRALARALIGAGAQAVIATNTLAQPAPDDPRLNAGVGGGRLFRHARRAAAWLADEAGGALDVIACGGVLDGASLRETLAQPGIAAAQYASALVFRGPLAAALIAQEAGL